MNAIFGWFTGLGRNGIGIDIATPLLDCSKSTQVRGDDVHIQATIAQQFGKRQVKIEADELIKDTTAPAFLGILATPDNTATGQFDLVIIEVQSVVA